MIGHEGIKTYPDQQFCDAIGQVEREVTCIDHRLIFALQSWSNHTFFFTFWLNQMSWFLSSVCRGCHLAYSLFATKGRREMDWYGERYNALVNITTMRHKPVDRSFPLPR